MAEIKSAIPIEKREIRGLTAESIIKYGVLLLAALFGYFTVQKKTEIGEIKNTEQDAIIQLLRTDNETLKIKQQTQETTIARLEERINQNSNRIK